MAPEYDSEVTASRDGVATALRDLADGVDAGAVRLGDGAGAISVAVPDEMDLEIELESDDGVSIEVEMEWAEQAGGVGETAPDADEGTAGADDDASTEATERKSPAEAAEPTAEERTDADDSAIDEATESPVPVQAATPLGTLARFELFRDRADEWRWRLVHRNGNVIATSGEGYTRKHNAQKGLRSVMENAPGAAVTENDGE